MSLRQFHSHSNQQHGHEQQYEREVDERLAWVQRARGEQVHEQADEGARGDERLGQRGGLLEGEADDLEERDEDGAPAHSGHGGEGADLRRR